jgi:hypothetical protein
MRLLQLGKIFSAVLVAAVAPAAFGNSIVYSTSFEDPPFTPGVITGQDGWNVFGPGVSTVENTFAESGTQAVFISGATASQSGPYHADTSTGTPYVDVSADIAIFTSSTQTEWQFAALGPNLTGYLGGINILANNEIVPITAGSQEIGTFTRATTFDGTAWQHIDLLFNMTAQTYSVTLNGTLLASGLSFCGSNSTCTGASLPTYGDGFFDSFGTGNDAAYMDNYSVTNVSGTPEPGTSMLMLGGAGLLALVRRR